MRNPVDVEERLRRRMATTGRTGFASALMALLAVWTVVLALVVQQGFFRFQRLRERAVSENRDVSAMLEQVVRGDGALASYLLGAGSQLLLVLLGILGFAALLRSCSWSRWPLLAWGLVAAAQGGASVAGAFADLGAAFPRLGLGTSPARSALLLASGTAVAVLTAAPWGRDRLQPGRLARRRPR